MAQKEGPPGFFQSNNGQQRNQASSSQQPMQSSSLERLLKQYIEKNEAVLQSQAMSIHNLKLQMGQIANELKSRPQGALPSSIELHATQGIRKRAMSGCDIVQWKDCGRRKEGAEQINFHHN